MEVRELKPGQVIRVWCKSDKSTLVAWLDEVVAVGEILQFSNYTNYGGTWLVTKVDKIDDYDRCKERWGDQWDTKKIRRANEVVEEA